jgi:hypothetical protein
VAGLLRRLHVRATPPHVMAHTKKPRIAAGLLREVFWLCVTSEGPAQVSALAWPEPVHCQGVKLAE